jgi:putative membrane protein
MIRSAALVAILGLAACSRGPGEQPRSVELRQPPTRPAAVTTPPETPPAEDQAFVNAAAGTDMFELQAANLALTRSKTPAVRRFAAMMLRDHRHSSAELQKALAEAEKTLVPAAALPPERQKDVLKLTTAELPDFDETYMKTQVEAHEDALQVLQHYAETGQTTSLKAFAGNTVAAVQLHHDHARQLLAQLEAQ